MLNNKHKKGDTSYNICTAFSLSGPLQSTLLQRSFQEIMARHSILRTCFTEDEGQAVQVVNENAPLAFKTTLASKSNIEMAADNRPITSPCWV